MISETTLRQLLIDSCYSSIEADKQILEHLESPEFISLLVKITVDAEDYEGDAPMQATYYLSMASPELTHNHETELLALLPIAPGYSSGVALTLGRMKSELAKPIITEMVAKGCWPIETFQKALSCYEPA